MSVQSEIARIQGAVTDQTSLIEQIKVALEGKAAGGGGVGSITATVTISGTVIATQECTPGSLVIIHFGTDYYLIGGFTMTFEDGTEIASYEYPPMNGLDQYGDNADDHSGRLAGIRFIAPNQDVTFSAIED